MRDGMECAGIGHRGCKQGSITEICKPFYDQSNTLYMQRDILDETQQPFYGYNSLSKLYSPSNKESVFESIERGLLGRSICSGIRGKMSVAV